MRGTNTERAFFPTKYYISPTYSNKFFKGLTISDLTRSAGLQYETNMPGIFGDRSAGESSISPEFLGSLWRVESQHRSTELNSNPLSHSTPFLISQFVIIWFFFPLLNIFVEIINQPSDYCRIFCQNTLRLQQHIHCQKLVNLVQILLFHELLYFC